MFSFQFYFALILHKLRVLVISEISQKYRKTVDISSIGGGNQSTRRKP